jgi:hypothetical protein
MWMQVLVNTPAGVRALALALIATGLEHRGQVHHPAAAGSRTRTVRSNLRRCFAVSDTPGMAGGLVFTALGSAEGPARSSAQSRCLGNPAEAPHVRVEMLLLPESLLANPIQVGVYNSNASSRIAE